MVFCQPLFLCYLECTNCDFPEGICIFIDIGGFYNSCFHAWAIVIRFRQLKFTDDIILLLVKFLVVCPYSLCLIHISFRFCFADQFVPHFLLLMGEPIEYGGVFCNGRTGFSCNCLTYRQTGGFAYFRIRNILQCSLQSGIQPGSCQTFCDSCSRFFGY